MSALSTHAPWAPPLPLIMTSVKRTDMTATDTTFNGWANWETWNASLWIGNDEFLYNTAKACVTYREGLETPWEKFVRCMTDGQIGRHLGQTPDGCRWDDPAIDADEMNEMIWEL
jgi:hypothetical protein